MNKTDRIAGEVKDAAPLVSLPMVRSQLAPGRSEHLHLPPPLQQDPTAQYLRGAAGAQSTGTKLEIIQAGTKD